MLRQVEPRHAYRLLNHGPVTLITSAHGGARNVMAASWVMPLDFDPPKMVVVINRVTCTRQLIDRSGIFGVNLPTRALAAQALATGRLSAFELERDAEVDKINALGLKSFAGRRLGIPLIEGCAAWLECRVIHEPRIETAYDLFVAEVITAWADERYFVNGRWLGDKAGAPRPATIHILQEASSSRAARCSRSSRRRFKSYRVTFRLAGKEFTRSISKFGVHTSLASVRDQRKPAAATNL